MTLSSEQPQSQRHCLQRSAELSQGKFRKSVVTQVSAAIKHKSLSSFLLHQNMNTESEDKETSENRLLPNQEKDDRDRITFDDVLHQLGEFGREQKINYFMFSLPYIMSAMQLMGWVFVGSELPHRCLLPEEVGLTTVSYNSSIRGDWSVDSCSRTRDNITAQCEDGWVYDRTQVTSAYFSKELKFVLSS